jgi:hypothetical protein
LFDGFELIRRQRLGLGILLFRKDLIKLFRLRERDANRIVLNTRSMFQRNDAKVSTELGRRRVFWLRTVQICLVTNNGSSKDMLQSFRERCGRRIFLFQLDEFIESQEVRFREADVICLRREPVTG